MFKDGELKYAVGSKDDLLNRFKEVIQGLADKTIKLSIKD